MTTKAVKALFWKEYRQHIALLIAMIVMCLLFQVVMYMTWRLFIPHIGDIGLSILTVWAAAFVVFYSIACSAILFAKEKEDKTDNFLRNMPISGGVVLVGKLLWLFGSMAALIMTLALVMVVWWLILPPDHTAELTLHETLSAVGWFFFYCFSGTCLGLFWSSISRKQLHAIVGTLTSMLILFFLVALVTFQLASPEQVRFNTLMCILYLVSCGVLGGIGLWNGGRWLRRREDKTLGAKIDALQNKQWRRKNVTIEQLRSQKQPRGEFRWLLWQCRRQSSGLFRFGIDMALLILCWPMMVHLVPGNPEHYRLHDFLEYGIPFFLIVGGYVILCNIFYPDHNKNGIMVLSQRGISPGKVWWSRMVMFGGLLAICLAALVGSQWINELLGKPISDLSPDAVLGFSVIFILFFAVGQFASIISRSLILPLLYTILFLFVGFWWFMYVMVVNDFGPEMERAASIFDCWPIAAVFLPIVLAFFVASRRRMSDWMRDRPLRASWRKLSTTFGVGLAISITLLAAFRLTTVPTASLGYKLDPWVLQQKIDYAANGERFVAVRESLKGDNNFADYLAARQEFKAMDENPLQGVGHGYFGDATLYYMISQQIMQPDVTPEFLREAIAFLETANEHRVPATVAVERYYERVINLIRTGEPMFSEPEPPWEVRFWHCCRVIAPWEKTRALRFAEYRFQTDSLLAEQSERLVFENEGDAKYLAEKIATLRVTAPSMLYSDYFYIIPATPYSIYLQEQGRRVAILEAALRLWYDEHGELPATLDELKGTYLTEVPLVPYYNRPFEYNPHPGEDDTLHGENQSHVNGTPYLMTKMDDQFPGVPRQTMIFDLTFAKK